MENELVPGRTRVWGARPARELCCRVRKAGAAGDQGPEPEPEPGQNACTAGRGTAAAWLSRPGTVVGVCVVVSSSPFRLLPAARGTSK